MVVAWSDSEKQEKNLRIAGDGRDTDHTSAEYKSERLPQQ